MKQLIVIIAIIFGMNNYASAQNVIINSEDYTQTVDDNQYYINGISTREDIGGVEIGRGKDCGNGFYLVKLTNYNDFTVTVLFEFSHSSYQNEKIEKRTMVLRAGETKETEKSYYDPREYVIITRKLGE